MASYGERNSLNDIENFLKRNFIVNDRTKMKQCSDREAEDGADRLMRKLSAMGCREFLIKVMYYLPYDDRENLLESALRPQIDNPAHYFTHCAKRKLERLGIK